MCQAADVKAAELKAILESFKQGKALENLASDLKVMLNKYPGDARILLHLGDSQKEMGDFDNALRSFAASIQAAMSAKNSEVINTAMLLRAECYQRMGKYQDAKKELTSLLTIDSSNAQACERAGYLLLQMSELNVQEAKNLILEAKSFFERALSFLEAEKLIQEDQLKLAEQQRKIEEEKKVREEAGNNEPIPDPEPELEEPSKKKLRHSIASNFYGLGQSFQNMGAIQEAVTVYETASFVDMTFAPAHHARGSCHMALKRWIPAAIDLTTFIEIFEYFKVAPEIAPGVTADHLLSDAVYRRGICRQQIPDVDMAISDFTHVIYMEGSFVPEAFFRRGKCYFDKGDYWKAIEDATASLRVDATNVGAFYLRAQAYEKVGKKDLAAEDTRMYQLLHRQRLFKSS